MTGASIRRGLAAGLLAGLLAGLFALAIGEIPLREAIAVEQAQAETASSASSDHAADDHDHTHDGAHAEDAAHASDGGHHHHGEDALVDRAWQQALLPVGSALVGAAFGGLFGLCFALVWPRLRTRDPWRASLGLGAVAWLAVALFPALTYPAAPPGAGDPGAVDSRTGWFLVAVVVGVALAAGLWAGARWLRVRGVPEVPRHVAVAAAGAAAYGLALWALPAGNAATSVPADLVWDFRLASMGTQLIMWAGIAAGFGWLWRRAVTGDRFGGAGPDPAGGPAPFPAAGAW